MKPACLAALAALAACWRSIRDMWSQKTAKPIRHCIPGTRQIKAGLPMNSSTVSAELELRCVIPHQATVPLAASFCYSREEPYAIRVAFHAGQDKPVEWTFARDLLSMGIVRCEGIGDVRVWPSADTAGSVLNIELCSPFGQAHFQASVKEISDFLRRTCQIVQAGEEGDHLDFESELTCLLRRGQ